MGDTGATPDLRDLRVRRGAQPFIELDRRWHASRS
jgi:hypothetical protein